MGFKEQMATDTAVFFNTNEFAEALMYNGTAGTGIVTIGQSNLKGNALTADGISDRAEIEISYTLKEQPQSGDIIVHNGKSWRVARILNSDGIVHVLECTSARSAAPFSR